MSRIVSGGYEFVSIKSLLNVQSADELQSKCAVTFDDGFKSTLTLAAPFLESKKIPYTVFVTVEFLNKPGYLSKEDLIELSHLPMCSIGIHSYKHKLWRYENSEELACDYKSAKKALDNIVSITDTFFAFPYGSYYAVSQRNIRTIRNCGANAVFLTTQCPLLMKDIKQPYALPRINIPGYYNGTVLSDRKLLRIGD